jgi:hypothetical protein
LPCAPTCTTLWCMEKAEVYSWRVAPRTKGQLEAVARRLGVSVAEVVDRAVSAWLKQHADAGDEDEQRRLQVAAREAIGMIRGKDPRRAERSKQTVRALLRTRRGR